MYCYLSLPANSTAVETRLLLFEVRMVSQVAKSIDKLQCVKCFNDHDTSFRR